MSDQPVIRARLEYEGRELIHNDLISAAFHLKERIRQGIANGQREGIGLDMMACITMTAFAFEAYLNFVGFHKIPDFDDAQSGKSKRKQIVRELDIPWDDNARPYSTIRELFAARDAMAHGKPRLIKSAWEDVGTHSELEEKLQTYRQGIEAMIDFDFVERAYDDVQSIWQLMIKSAEINLMDTLDGGYSGIEFLSFAERKE
jgi:hypothetical protein